LASWADEKNEHDHPRQPFLCLACGTPLDEPFTRLGSLRCVECRSSERSLDPELVGEWQANGGQLH